MKFKKYTAFVSRLLKAGGAGLLLNILASLQVLAGDPNLPCDGDGDPYSSGTNCPMDNWVYVVAVLMMGFAVFHLYHKKRLIQQ